MTDRDFPTPMRSREPPDAAAQPPPPKSRKVLFEEGDTPSFLIGPYHYSLPHGIHGPRVVRRVTGQNPDGTRRLEQLCSTDVAAIVADGEEGSRAFGRLPGTSNGTVDDSSRRSSGLEPADLGPLNAKVGCGQPVTAPAEKSSGNRLNKSPKNRAVGEPHVFSGNRTKIARRRTKLEQLKLLRKGQVDPAGSAQSQDGVSGYDLTSVDPVDPRTESPSGTREDGEPSGCSGTKFPHSGHPRGTVTSTASSCQAINGPLPPRR